MACIVICCASTSILFFAHYPSVYSTITLHESVKAVFVFSVELSYLSTLKIALEF
jgi:hypothetical protein